MIEPGLFQGIRFHLKKHGEAVIVAWLLYVGTVQVLWALCVPVTFVVARTINIALLQFPESHPVEEPVGIWPFFEGTAAWGLIALSIGIALVCGACTAKVDGSVLNPSSTKRKASKAGGLNGCRSAKPYFLAGSAFAYFRRKRSTRPAVSKSFCFPVKNGWQAEQISTWISPLWVERVTKLLPQAHMTRTSLYAG